VPDASATVMDIETLKRDPVAIAKLLRELGLADLLSPAPRAAAVREPPLPARPEPVPAKAIRRPGAEMPPMSTPNAPRAIERPIEPRSPDVALASKPREPVQPVDGVAAQPVRDTVRPQAAACSPEPQGHDSAPITPMPTRMPMQVPRAPTPADSGNAELMRAAGALPLLERVPPRPAMNELAAPAHVAPSGLAPKPPEGPAESELAVSEIAQPPLIPEALSTPHPLAEWASPVQNPPPQDEHDVRAPDLRGSVAEPEQDTLAAQRREEFAVKIRALLGGAPFVDDLVRGLDDVPPEGLEVLMRFMPPDLLPGGKGG
jgi:hypothetical protein